MKIMKKLILIVGMMGIISSAPVSATIWDDAKEFAETHKKKIVIGAAIVVAAAAVAGGIGGKIAYDRYFKKNVAQGTRAVRDVIDSVNESAKAPVDISAPSPTSMQSTESAQIVVVNHNLNSDSARGFVSVFVERLNKENPKLNAALFSGQNPTNPKGLLMLTQAGGRALESELKVSVPFEQNPSLNDLNPKILMIICPDLTVQPPYCKEVTREVTELRPNITNIFSKVFQISNCGRTSWTTEKQWLPVTSHEYNSTELKAMLGRITAAFLNKQ